MRSLTRRLVDAAIGTIAIIGVGIGMAAAADIPPLPGPPQAPEYYGGPPQLYGNPPPPEAYPYAPPAPAYAYPPPPPAYYYGPPVAVAPQPYYPRRYYGAWGYAPYRGYWNRGHYRW